MNVYFYKTFGKRNNSTKRPSITDTTAYTIHDCKLKENCSEHNPIFILSSDEFNYLYAYVPAWHKFYFTTDVVSMANGLLQYTMAEDQLASFKMNIATTYARIMYSSAGYDTDIIDSRIQIKNHRTGNFAANFNDVFSGTSGYIVSVFNTAGNMASSGPCVSYLLSESGMNKFRGWLGLTGVSDAISGYMNGGLTDAILSCVWIPYWKEVRDSDAVVSRTQMVVGDRYSYDDDHVSFSGDELYSLVSRPVISKTIGITTGLRYSDFRQYEPYTTSAIYLPGIGTVSLSRNEWGDSDITVNVHIDAVTGDLKYQLVNDVGTVIADYNCNVAAQCGVGQVINNGGGILSGIGSAAAGAATLAAGAVSGGSAAVIVGGALATVAGIANTVMSTNQHSASVSGGNSSRLASVNRKIRYYENSVDTEDPDDPNYIALQGRPYNGVGLLSLVAGALSSCYFQCIDARVSPSTYDSTFKTTTRPTLREQEEINAFLNSGFYYE